MNRYFKFLGPGAFGVLLIASACGGETRATGSEQGSCYPNGTCNAGLSCLSHLCVSANGPDGGSNEDATSHGNSGGATGSGGTGAGQAGAGNPGAGGTSGTGARGSSGGASGSGGAGGASDSGGAGGASDSGGAGGATNAGGTAGVNSGGANGSGGTPVTGTCSAATCAGTCQANGCAVRLLTEGSLGGVPSFIVQDADNLYFPVFNAGIYSVAKKGSAPQFLQASNGTVVYSMAVWSGNLYLGGGGITSIPVTGGSATPVAQTNGFTRLAIQSGVIYYGSVNGVFSVPITGGTPTPLGGNGTISPSAIALDSAAIYWVGAQSPQATLPNAIERVALTGGAVTTIASAAQQNGYIVALTIDATSAYWVDTATVMKGPLGGGSATPLTSADFGQSPPALTVDDGNLYFTTISSVCKMPVGGGPVTTLATGTSAGVLAVDATSVYYWSSGGGPVRLTPK